MKYQIVIATFPRGQIKELNVMKEKVSEILETQPVQEGNYNLLVSDLLSKKELVSVEKKLKVSGIRFSTRQIEEEKEGES